MQAVVLGLSQKGAPVALLERLSLAGHRLREALSCLSEYVGQGVILSTCNRTEIYTVGQDGEDVIPRLKAFLKDHLGLEPQALPFYTHSGEEAVCHLFRVAAGLDSMVVGETEVQGQIRAALEAAGMAGMVSFPLSRLFHRALRVGRKARLETGISRKAASVSSVGVELAARAFADLRACHVLVISTGRTGKLVAANLRSKGCSHITVANRTYRRAVELAAELGGEAILFRERYQALAQSDIVITATSSPSFILEEGPMSEALLHRDGRPLFILDLAVPRDVEPGVRRLSGVQLYDIDDLQSISEVHRQERAREAERAEVLVAEEASRFMAWWQTLRAIPTIKGLHTQVEAIRQAELQKTLKKLSHLSPEDRARIDSLTRALVNKLLHQPTQEVKEHASREDYLGVARHLFGLGDEVEPGPRANR